MAKIQKGHYHCLECGALFEANVVPPREQRCPVCEHPPTGKFLAGTEEDREAVNRAAKENLQATNASSDLHGVSQDTRDIYEATIEAQGKGRHGRVKRTKRKERKKKKLYIFLVVWLLLMVATVFIVKHFSEVSGSETVAGYEADKNREAKQKAYEEQKKRMIVQAAVPSCEAVMTSFLNSPSAALKAQYVYEGSKLSGVMSRYYRSNPSFSSTRSVIKIIRADLLGFEDEKVIGAICKNSLGEKFEVIFVNSESEWKIDWLSLVRYDPSSWSLFRAGSDGDEGEFRLYMRVRNSHSDLEQKHINVVFYKPNMYVKNEFTGLATPALPIKADSPLGEQLKKLQQDADEGKGDGYGFPIEEFDPPGYHRVRVKLRLKKQGAAPSALELLEIIDVHWYGIDQLTETADSDPVR